MFIRFSQLHPLRRAFVRVPPVPKTTLQRPTATPPPTANATSSPEIDSARAAMSLTTADRKITFRLHAAPSPDFRYKVVGSHPVLGGWDPDKGILMTPTGQSQSNYEISLDVGSVTQQQAFDLEYKYVQANTDGRFRHWEECENRRIHVPSPEGKGFDLLVIDKWGDREASSKEYVETEIKPARGETVRKLAPEDLTPSRTQGYQEQEHVGSGSKQKDERKEVARAAVAGASALPPQKKPAAQRTLQEQKAKGGKRSTQKAPSTGQT